MKPQDRQKPLLPPWMIPQKPEKPRIQPELQLPLEESIRIPRGTPAKKPERGYDEIQIF
ncbi:hypothetical protein JXA56_00495 [Candidatus Micrarchaeota archaeon]|nr:hypothetical protein [Candidatus Micrarchaeota archaeon]